MWHIAGVKWGADRGSNQYQRRGAPHPDRRRADVEFIQQLAGPPQQLRCSELWGGLCSRTIRPPDWSCGRHPRPAKLSVAIERSPRRLIPLLAAHPDPRVRRLVAAGSNCPPGMLADLTKDEDTVVATLALENPRCPRTARLLATHSTDLIV